MSIHKKTITSDLVKIKNNFSDLKDSGYKNSLSAGLTSIKKSEDTLWNKFTDWAYSLPVINKVFDFFGYETTNQTIARKSADFLKNQKSRLAKYLTNGVKLFNEDVKSAINAMSKEINIDKTDILKVGISFKDNGNLVAEDKEVSLTFPFGLEYPTGKNFNEKKRTLNKINEATAVSRDNIIDTVAKQNTLAGFLAK